MTGLLDGLIDSVYEYGHLLSETIELHEGAWPITATEDMAWLETEGFLS